MRTRTSNEPGRSVGEVAPVDVELPGNAVERPGQLLAAGLGRAAHRGGDLRPGAAFAAEVGGLSLLVDEATTDLFQQLDSNEHALRVGFTPRRLLRPDSHP